jgi:predicted component of type VI protein secretion system
LTQISLLKSFDPNKHFKRLRPKKACSRLLPKKLTAYTWPMFVIELHSLIKKYYSLNSILGLILEQAVFWV